MSELIEVSVDNKGRIVISAEILERLGLSPGMMLVVEERERGEVCLRVQKELPELVDKQGVLVVKSEAVGDLAEAVENEHSRRLFELIQRAGL